MPSLNRVVLLGHVGGEADMKYSVSGTAYARFSLATNRYVKDGDDETDWHRVVCFGSWAENASNYMKKGDLVMVEGEIHYSRQGEGDDTRYYTEIVASRVFNLAPRDDAARPPKGDPALRAKVLKAMSGGDNG